MIDVISNKIKTLRNPLSANLKEDQVLYDM